MKPSPSEPLGNPYMAGPLFLGLVKDAFAHSGTYIVRTPVGTLLTCSDMSDGSMLPVGARPGGMYMPGTSVIVLQVPGTIPLIIGSAPTPVQDGRLLLPDSFVLRSRVGQWEDSMHYDVFRDPKSPFFNFSMGRPADVLPGDWGRVNDLGLAVMLGRTMAMLRGSDAAQVQAFWNDDLLRLVGYNMEMFTAATEDRRGNDQGEYNEVWRGTPFIWEGMGNGQTRGETLAVKSGILKPGENYAPLEPVEDDQLIVPRHMILKGYLGDVEREYVMAPPQALGISQFANKDVYAGLLEILKQGDGSYSIRSAKQISFEKYTLIPVPKELIAPEDPTGDTESNYKFAGQFGDGEAHDMPEFEWASTDRSGIKTAQLWDYHAYFFNKYTPQGLTKHLKDWFVPEETEIEAPTTRTVYQPSLEIGHKFYASMATPQELKLDDRPDHTVKYYGTRSIIKQNDDGSIVLEDGYGSQIRMEGGNIFMSATGDIWMQPGRNFIVWAPHDAILRAGNSADITAAKKDVRIKAEQNFHTVSGNGGTGSTLIECRSEGPPVERLFKDKIGESCTGNGIFFKAMKSAVTVWSQYTYIGGENGKPRVISIDAGNTGFVAISGEAINCDAVAEYNWAVGDTETSEVKQLMHFSAGLFGTSVDTNVFNGNTLIEGILSVSKQVACHSQVFVESGVYSNGGYFALNSDTVARYKKKIEITPKVGIGTAIVNTVKAQAVEQRSAIHDTFQKAPNGQGTKELQQAVGFSCRRTVEDYKLDEESFILLSARWQQIMEQKDEGQTWDEPVVHYPDRNGGTETYPHPGREGWLTYQAYETPEFVNFDVEEGHAKDRAELADVGSTTQDTLKNAYKINVQE